MPYLVCQESLILADKIYSWQRYKNQTIFLAIGKLHFQKYIFMLSVLQYTTQPLTNLALFPLIPW